MKQIEHDGKIYYYNNGSFFDEFFLMLEGEELRVVSKDYFKKIPWDTLTGDELFEAVKDMKVSGLSYETAKILDKIFLENANDGNLIYKLLPLYMSCYRELGQPQKAIKCAEEYLSLYGGSIATYTSLAAAYCDVKDYEKAKKYARLAYAKQGGGKGYATELSLVFRRLKKETGEVFYDNER